MSREGDELFGQRSGRAKQPLLFFTPGAPSARKLFVRDASGRVDRLIDRRDGRDVVWKRAAKKP